MKKTGKREHVNLFFSAFLILAFIICAYFFSGFSASMDLLGGQLVMIAVYAVFGLLLFYATRVGDGKAVFRFSPLTLIVLVLPALAILLASLAPFMPFHDVLSPGKTSGQLSVVTILAAVALGYGIPYTFISGFEQALEEEATEDDDAAAPEILEGGVEADLQDAGEEASEESSEESVFMFTDDSESVQSKNVSAADEQEDKGYSLDTFDTDSK